MDGTPHSVSPASPVFFFFNELFITYSSSITYSFTLKEREDCHTNPTLCFRCAGHVGDSPHDSPGPPPITEVTDLRICLVAFTPAAFGTPSHAEPPATCALLCLVRWRQPPPEPPRRPPTSRRRGKPILLRNLGSHMSYFPPQANKQPRSRRRQGRNSKQESRSKVGDASSKSNSANEQARKQAGRKQASGKFQAGREHQACRRQAAIKQAARRQLASKQSSSKQQPCSKQTEQTGKRANKQ